MLKLKDKILYCLERYPETRNSDIKLTNAVWYTYYEKYLIKVDDQLAVKLTDLYELPREDDVKRIRAKIQNDENKFLPTDEAVRKQRRINETKWRNYLGYNDNIRNLQYDFN